jgi:hypothetical protein
MSSGRSLESDAIARILLIWYDIFVNCKWVATRWQLYNTHLHTSNTQNDTKQTIHRTIQKVWKSAGRAPTWRVIPWHLPYNWGKSTEKPQSRILIVAWFLRTWFEWKLYGVCTPNKKSVKWHSFAKNAVFAIIQGCVTLTVIPKENTRTYRLSLVKNFFHISAVV